jgi:Stress responsive A/B Barrel Domain
MKKFFLLTAIVIISGHTMQAQKIKTSKTLRHVVMFGWDAGTDSTEIEKVVDAFKKLPGKINLIKGFEWGTNNSPESLNQGLTHCFFLSFTSQKDRDEYLVHPAHQEFVALKKPGLTKVTVLDYWAQ